MFIVTVHTLLVFTFRYYRQTSKLAKEIQYLDITLCSIRNNFLIFKYALLQSTI